VPSPAVLAVDVGGTSIKAAVVDERGRTLRSETVPTPVLRGPDAVVEAVREVAGALCGPGVEAAGVVVPGVVEAGVARYAANLGWRDVPLRDLLAAQLSVAVVVDHDVRAAGLAERTSGAARDVADCLIVVIGTGIAALVVAGGVQVGGATGLAGELGHLPVYPDGEPCACGQRGCVETYASAAAIARRYRALTGLDLNAQQIVAALGSDPAADEVWTQATDALGLGLAAATLLLDPSLVVLGGGLAGAGQALGEPTAAALRAQLAWRPAPRVEVSPLAGRAGLVGAALLAWRAAGHPRPL
jgi:glucokinase